MDDPLTQVAVKPKGTNKTYEGVTKNETNIFVPTATVRRARPSSLKRSKARSTRLIWTNGHTVDRTEAAAAERRHAAIAHSHHSSSARTVPC